MKQGLYIAIAIGAFVLWAAPAHADNLATWVATTCDPQSGRAIVRFGYADDDAPPLFYVQEETSLDGGMSAIPVTNASELEATCTLSTKREVKIRRADDGSDQYSIWVDGVRIVHDRMDINKVPFEFVIDVAGFRQCTFKLLSGDIYDVTSAAGKPHPPIDCDSALTPISGARRRPPCFSSAGLWSLPAL